MPAGICKPGERVLLRVDNWHDPMVIEASKKILEKYGCKYEIRMVEKGPIPQWKGADEVEYYLHRTKELADWMDQWDVISKEGKYDKLLWGYGGPVLCDTDVKIQRMPFITPEILASPAHTMPYELLQAIDLYTWKRILKAKRVRIQDPGRHRSRPTPITTAITIHAASSCNPTSCATPGPATSNSAAPTCPAMCSASRGSSCPAWKTATAIVAGTTNHIAPCDWTQLVIENSRVTQILEGGEFGDKLRKLKAETDHLQYPGFPGKGLMYWWEASIGTNPHIHRPRKDFPSGFVNCLYERVRSGVIHIGFGTIISSMAERIAARQGLPVGHWHLHLYFPTVTLEMEGDNETIIENGRLCALDDPDIRKMAAKYGDADLWLDESWIPAVPGLNVQGEYWRDYGRDPMKWVKSRTRYLPQLASPVHADGRRRSEILSRQQEVLDDRRRRARSLECCRRDGAGCWHTARSRLRLQLKNNKNRWTVTVTPNARWEEAAKCVAKPRGGISVGVMSSSGSVPARPRLSLPRRAFAAYPDKPIKLIVPFPAGGGGDALARTVSAKVSDILGQQFVIDNRAGRAAISEPRPRRARSPTAIRSLTAPTARTRSITRFTRVPASIRSRTSSRSRA